MFNTRTESETRDTKNYSNPRSTAIREQYYKSSKTSSNKTTSTHKDSGNDRIIPLYKSKMNKPK